VQAPKQGINHLLNSPTVRSTLFEHLMRSPTHWILDISTFVTVAPFECIILHYVGRDFAAALSTEDKKKPEKFPALTWYVSWWIDACF